MTENTQIDETAGTDVNDAPVTEYTSESVSYTHLTLPTSDLG